VAGGVEAAHLILGHADRVLDAAQDDGAVAGEPLDQLVSLSATTTVLTTRGEVRFLGPNVVPRAPRANTRKRLQETRGEALPRCGPCVARNVTVHESRVTSVQKRMEPRRSLLGASVDVTEARRRNGQAHLPGPLQGLDLARNQSCGPGQVQRLVRRSGRRAGAVKFMPAWRSPPSR